MLIARSWTDVTANGTSLNRSTTGYDARPVAVEAAQDLLADVAVGVVHEVGDADPVEVVADGEGQAVAGGRHDPEGLDHGRSDGLVPVREELADRGVELLVALAAGHQQVGVVLALGEAGTQPLGVLAETAPVGRDHAPAGGDVLPEEMERLVHVHVGQHGLRHDERERLTGGERLDDATRLGGAVRRAEVVVARVPAELVEQVVGVLLGHEQDHGAVVHTQSLERRTP